MQMRLPHRLKVAALATAFLALSGCNATLKTYDSEGRVSSDAKIPPGFAYDIKAQRIETDRYAVDAATTVSLHAINKGGDAFMRYAIEKAMQAKPQAQP